MLKVLIIIIAIEILLYFLMDFLIKKYPETDEEKQLREKWVRKFLEKEEIGDILDKIDISQGERASIKVLRKAYGLNKIEAKYLWEHCKYIEKYTPKFESYKHHSVIKWNGEYSIVWNRGRKSFDFDVTEDLVDKSRKSDKDALEVMFYLEHER